MSERGIWEHGPYFWHWCEPCRPRVTQTHECQHHKEPSDGR